MLPPGSQDIRYKITATQSADNRTSRATTVTLRGKSVTLGSTVSPDIRAQVREPFVNITSPKQSEKIAVSMTENDRNMSVSFPIKGQAKDVNSVNVRVSIKYQERTGSPQFHLHNIPNIPVRNGTWDAGTVTINRRFPRPITVLLVSINANGKDSDNKNRGSNLNLSPQ